MSENMRIYEQVRSVPKEAQKDFNNGRFSGTDINPMWRIKKLTELFGPAGIGWYTEIISQRSEHLGEAELMATVEINLYVKMDGEWSKPIYGTGANMLISATKKGLSSTDEGYKMAYTDALSVACKALGIGADVYFEKDATKYTDKPQPAPPPPPPAPAMPQMATPDQIEYIRNNTSDELYMQAMTAFGPELTKMTYKQALQMMGRINNAR